MKQQISPAKLLTFLRKLYLDLEQVQGTLDDIEQNELTEQAIILVESMLSDVGDQILLLPHELHAKPGQRIPTEKELKAAYKKTHPRA